MRIAFWTLLAGLLTCFTAYAVYRTALSDDRKTFVSCALLSLCSGWYMITNWGRACRAVRERPFRPRNGHESNAGT
ncbi:hypothetical protein [Streptomyces sp. Tue6028]|uniref:hypothetical protein n=1 Tax=Streptomyces sp. Tue6028 TaxID=2036037 RepID=UPI003EBECF0B